MLREDTAFKNKKFCSCGCGEEIIPFDSRGRSRRFKHGHNWKDNLIIGEGEKHPRWKGGISTEKKGYTNVIKKSGSKSRRYSGQHREVMAIHLGRELKSNEHVHHKNEDKHDNRIENLELVTVSEHGRLHNLGKHKDFSDRFCIVCKSNTTAMRMPSAKSNNRTPSPRWYHLSNDKINWYCSKCYKKQIRKFKKMV